MRAAADAQAFAVDLEEIGSGMRNDPDDLTVRMPPDVCVSREDDVCFIRVLYSIGHQLGVWKRTALEGRDPEKHLPSRITQRADNEDQQQSGSKKLKSLGPGHAARRRVHLRQHRPLF